MSNPVFTRMEADWREQEAFKQVQESYNAPAVVPAGRMTYDDVVVRTGLSLLTLTVMAALSWWFTTVSPGAAGVVMGVSSVAGLIVAMVNIFGKQIRPALVLLYSGLQGVALGSLSALVQAALPGVVIQAVIATVVVFSVTLLLFASGKVRNSPKLMKFALISLIGIILSRLLIWILTSVGVLSPALTDVTFLGIPLPVFISLFAVVVGAICLIGDFDQVRIGVQMGAPSKYAWACAFGIMVTVVWLYVEILNILSQMNRN